MECGMPDGKYQRSPTPTSSTKFRPCASTRGDARAAVQHVGPFGSLVPMQLAYAAGVQPHVHAGDVLGDAKLARGHLAGPAAGLQPHVRIGEREAQVRQRAVIGRGRESRSGFCRSRRDCADRGRCRRARDAGAAVWVRRFGRWTSPPRAGFRQLRWRHVATRDGIHDVLQSCQSRLCRRGHVALVAPGSVGAREHHHFHALRQHCDCARYETTCARIFKARTCRVFFDLAPFAAKQRLANGRHAAALRRQTKA